jgi:Cytochrome P450
MVPNDATDRGTRRGVMTCHMANDAPDGGALDAPMRTSDGGKHAQQQDRQQQSFSHVNFPHATGKYEFIEIARMENAIAYSAYATNTGQPSISVPFVRTRFAIITISHVLCQRTRVRRKSCNWTNVAPPRIRALRRRVSKIEEVLRFRSVVHWLPRVVRQDEQFLGQELKEGNLVLPVFAAANRDGAQFPDPDRFDIRRSPKDRRCSPGLGPLLHSSPIV